jgi:hypothetical protein
MIMGFGEYLRGLQLLDGKTPASLVTYCLDFSWRAWSRSRDDIAPPESANLEGARKTQCKNADGINRESTALHSGDR